MARLLPKALDGQALPAEKPCGTEIIPIAYKVNLPTLSWYDGCADFMSKAASSPYSQAIYAGECPIVSWMV